MAMVSGRRLNLNPDAALFVPAAVQQVEDFSPEWWQLVTTSTWYHDYWISQHQGGVDGFFDGDEVDLLRESFDDFDDMEDLFEADEFEQGEIYHAASDFGKAITMNNNNGEMVRRSSGNRRSRKLMVEPAKYAEKAAKWGSQRVAAPRNIHQPR